MDFFPASNTIFNRSIDDLRGSNNTFYGTVRGHCIGSNNYINGSVMGHCYGSNNVIAGDLYGDCYGANNTIHGKFNGTMIGQNNKLLGEQKSTNKYNSTQHISNNSDTVNQNLDSSTSFMGTIINLRGVTLSSPDNRMITVTNNLIFSPCGKVLVNGALEYKTPVNLSDIISGSAVPITKEPIPDIISGVIIKTPNTQSIQKLIVPTYIAETDNIISKSDEDQCGVCMEFKKNCAFVSCGHQFCGRCVDELHKKIPVGVYHLKCPTCRQDSDKIIKLF